MKDAPQAAAPAQHVAQVKDENSPSQKAPVKGVKSWLGSGTRDHFNLKVPEYHNQYGLPDPSSG